MIRLRFALALLLLPAACPGASTPPPPGPFFEAEQPFFQTPLLVAKAESEKSGEENFVVRGIVLRMGPGHAAIFDQELLRMAALWEVPAGQPLTTLQTMPQISYVQRGQKVNDTHPEPVGRLLLTTGERPGAGVSMEQLRNDPRPPARPGDSGRGPLPASRARFEGVGLAGDSAVLSYRVGDVPVREWWTAEASPQGPRFLRHFEAGPRRDPLVFALGRPAGRLTFRSNTPDVAVASTPEGFVATVAPSATTVRFTLALAAPASFSATPPGQTPSVPAATAARRWPQSVDTSVDENRTDTNGLALDLIAVPEINPWNRRMRAADLAFLNDDRAAVVTYEGDVWFVDGLGAERLSTPRWQRFASGLSEPLAIARNGDALLVATRNGVVRLHDRDGNGEADWFENFNDQMLQSRSTRAFPLDLAVAPDGSTYVTQGGITTSSGIRSGGTGTAHTGAVLKISPDGRTTTAVATRAREPFVAVHPVTGLVTATDQQGHFIPSSVVYHIRPGDDYGFPDPDARNISPPLTWIPHEQDPSSTSQVWMVGDGMGPWNGRLLHLSYNTGRLLLISADVTGPVSQGAAIPLGVRTELPLLHARMHPRGDAVFLAGFQIWGSRASVHSGIGRLRPGKSPISTALGARAMRDGVILEFAAPLDPASLTPESVGVRLWNYRRSRAYGSGRFALDGEAGTTPWGIAQVVPSHDGRSVFVHLPGLPPAMQLEVRHDFRFADGTPARGAAYLTVHEAARADFAGFPAIDFSKEAAAIVEAKEPPPSIDSGRALAESLGCIACHSTDGTTEGKVGPTWRNLYLSTRTFADGTTDVADDVYLREKILDPMRRRVSTTPVEMPSYRGVLSEPQLESVVLFIKSLRGPPRRGD
jgi:hypothetical protein